MDAQKCPVCGSHALGPVVSTGSDGSGPRPVCSECERRRLWEEQRSVRAIESYAARLLIYAGTLLISLTLVADRLSIAGRSGFGWRQITGLEVGAVCLVVGVISGRGLLSVGGLFLVVLSVGADLFSVGHAPGFGWRSQTALAVSCLLVVGGVLWELAMRRQGVRRVRP